MLPSHVLFLPCYVHFNQIKLLLTTKALVTFCSLYFSLIKQQNFRLLQTGNIYRQQIKPLPDDKILDWSKMKQIADDILKCIQNENKCHIGYKTL